jgi:hypothetical protein
LNSYRVYNYRTFETKGHATRNKGEQREYNERKSLGVKELENLKVKYILN